MKQPQTFEKSSRTLRSDKDRKKKNFTHDFKIKNPSMLKSNIKHRNKMFDSESD